MEPSEPYPLKSDDELWARGDDELAEVLANLLGAAVWLCIGFGDEEDVHKVPPHSLMEAPDDYRMN